MLNFIIAGQKLLSMVITGAAGGRLLELLAPKDVITHTLAILWRTCIENLRNRACLLNHSECFLRYVCYVIGN